jgi:hypothetical protein
LRADVGFTRKMLLFLRTDERREVEIEGVGMLRNTASGVQTSQSRLYTKLSIRRSSQRGCRRRAIVAATIPVLDVYVADLIDHINEMRNWIEVDARALVDKRKVDEATMFI